MILQLLLGGTLMAASATTPPIAARKPHPMEIHGDVRIDPYFWLKERESADVIKYLEAENAYADAVLEPTKKLQEDLFKELRSRIKEDDMSAPVKEGAYEYYDRTETGKEYPIYCRRKLGAGAKEEIMLDVNELAEGHAYFQVAGYHMSPDHRIMAYPVDTVGRRFYTIHFKDLETGRELPDRIVDVTPSFAWAADNKTVFYSKQHPESLRSEKIFRHELGSRDADVLLYEEKDETFDVAVGQSLSKRYIFAYSGSTLSTEIRYLRADDPRGAFTVFQPREKNHEYDVEDGGDRFFIRTNKGAKNFRLMESPLDRTARKNWKEVVPHRKDTFIERFDAFAGHLALEVRKGGLALVEIADRKTKRRHFLEFNDPAYVAALGRQGEYDSPFVRFSYESLTTPPSIIDYDVKAKKQIVRKVREVPGGFKASDYKSERLLVRAKDGTRVPVSVLYRKDRAKNAVRPGLVYGYGAYGLSMDPHFSTTVLSLVDRGFTYAIAHIRGGSEMGRAWYDGGRVLNKKNTFTDFIAATETLMKQKLITPGHAYAMGGSAGGLLMGAVTNMRPDLYRGVVAQVPFVDVVTTMLDDSLPLTTAEYDEWGNPNVKKYYAYIKSYSPYDNVKAAVYPSLYVSTGLHDSQVQYWEPAKWVAKLRTVNKGAAPILLRTEMKAGHGGKSGRFQRLHEKAEEYAFILQTEGLKQ